MIETWRFSPVKCKSRHTSCHMADHQALCDLICPCVQLLCGCELQVYSPAGRRLLPAMQLGSAPVFLASDSGWRLLAVTQLGWLLLWDLKEQRLVAESSIEPLLHSGPSHLTGLPHFGANQRTSPASTRVINILTDLILASDAL